MTTQTTPAGVKIAQALFDVCFPHGRLVRYNETAWTSRTFSGAQHNFIIRFSGDQAVSAMHQFMARVVEDDIPLPDHLVADINVTGHRRGSDNGLVYADVDVVVLTMEGAW